MQTIASASALGRRVRAWRRAGERIGLVPTMGALHEGHLALIRRARRECDRVMVTIYVNPTQFGPKEDLARYPRPRARDLALCRAEQADLVFAPANLYAPDHSTWIEEQQVSQGRDGAARPGHFRGVATVVLKLFHLAQPDRAYFGQKDAQQVEVIRRMVRDLNVPVRIVTVPTVRARDGVALSSRNAYLSPAERVTAAVFARLLKEAAGRGRAGGAWLKRALARVPGLRIDYVEVAGGRLCAAVFVGRTRLIDNRALN